MLLQTSLDYDYEESISSFERVIFTCVAFAVVSLYLLSGGVLYAVFGINYNGVSGAIFSKVHPSSYVIIFAFLLYFLQTKNDGLLFLDRIWQYKAVTLMIFVDFIYAIFVVTFERNAIAATIDTYLLTALIIFMVAQTKEELQAKLELLIHSALFLNACLGIFELIINRRFFPYVQDGVGFDWDTRSAAFMGHPLSNASITGAYVMILLFGGGLRLPALMKAFIVLVQFAAIGAFGGRTTFVLVLIGMVGFVVMKLINFMRGERLSLMSIAGFLLGAPLAVGGMASLFMTGTFDVLLNRFMNDAGSANARLVIYELFDYITFKELLWGADLGLIRSLQYRYGLEMGIENPIVRNVLTQGALMSILLFTAIGSIFTFLVMRTTKISLIPMAFFLIIIMSFESIAGKTILLAQFCVLMVALYPSKYLDQEY